MSSFQEFSEAAKLYAQNAPVVDEMFRAFYREMEKFSAALDPAVEALVPAGKFKSCMSHRNEEADGCPRHKYVWLADDDKDCTRHSYLYMDLWDESLVASNRLWLKASAPKANQEQLSRLWLVPTLEHLKGFCELRKRKPWSFLKLQFELSKDNHIEAAAEHIAAVLKALYEAENGKAL